MSDLDDSISAGEVVLWLVFLLLGLGFALFVRTMIIRHMRRRIRERQLEVLSAMNRRKRGAGIMTRKMFVEQNLSSYAWEPTDGSSELGDNDGVELQSVQNAECSICLAQLNRGDLVSKSNNRDCNHVFHKECVQEWLVLHVECPMCRKEFLIPPIFYSIQENTEWFDSIRTAAATDASTDDLPSETQNGEEPTP